MLIWGVLIGIFIGAFGLIALAATDQSDDPL
jgi:hypothetical protein